MRRPVDDLRRNHPVLEDLLFVVDVVQKQVQRRDALDEPGLHQIPLRPGNKPRHGVEREHPLGAAFVAVDGEGHPLLEKEQFKVFEFLFQLRRPHAEEPFRHRPVVGAHAAVRVHEFVEEICWFVGFEEHPSL